MEHPLTPLRFLQRSAAVHPGRTAIIDGPRTFTYAAMAAQITRLANALRNRVCSPVTGSPTLPRTAPRCWSPHFAVPLAGGVLVSINTRLAAEEIARSWTIPARCSC